MRPIMRNRTSEFVKLVNLVFGDGCDVEYTVIGNLKTPGRKIGQRANWDPYANGDDAQMIANKIRGLSLYQCEDIYMARFGEYSTRDGVTIAEAITGAALAYIREGGEYAKVA